MSDFQIRRGETATLDRVEGKLKIGNQARIEATNGKNVTVAEGVYLEGKAYVDCDLECDSVQSEIYLSKKMEVGSGSNRARLELTGKYPGKLEVNGNLTVHNQLNVSHSVEAKGLIDAGSIDVGGKIHASEISCGQIRVGGSAEVDRSFEAKSVDIGGKVYAPGIVKLGDLRVGGEAEVGGGSITGNIQIGGKFIARTALEFGELLVYGTGFLPANCKGRRISALGKLTVDGDISCDRIEVGGVVEVRGNCHAKKVEVGGKLDVSGSLFASDMLESYGAAEIEGNFESNRIHTVGKFEAAKVIINDEADLSGKIETRLGLKAKHVFVRSGTRCEGALIGEQVEIGKSPDLSHGAWGSMWATKWVGGNAHVEDIYASSVIMGTSCRAEHIFSDIVVLERGCTVHQITYTRELRTDDCVNIVDPPKKVTELPSPPF